MVLLFCHFYCKYQIIEFLYWTINLLFLHIWLIFALLYSCSWLLVVYTMRNFCWWVNKLRFSGWFYRSFFCSLRIKYLSAIDVLLGFKLWRTIFKAWFLRSFLFIHVLGCIEMIPGRIFNILFRGYTFSILVGIYLILDFVVYFQGKGTRSF